MNPEPSDTTATELTVEVMAVRWCADDGDFAVLAAVNDPRWPPIPTQDFRNLPRQQKGLHTKGFEFMRLSNKAEGLISNYHRLIDGYLAGLDKRKLLGAVGQVSGCIDVPCKDLGL